MLQAMLFAFGERKCLMMGATRETLTNYKFIALMNSHNITFIRSLKMISMKWYKGRYILTDILL